MPGTDRAGAAAEQADQAETGGEQAKNRGQFRKGRSGNPAGRPKKAGDAPAQPGAVPVIGSGSQLLDDYRHVYQNDASQDRTPGQKALRVLFEKDAGKFIGQFTKLEEAALAGETGGARSPAAEPEPVERDAGTARCLGLLDEWLADPANRDVQDGRCVNCGQPVPSPGA